jgi:DNA adenine methylase
VVQNLSEKQNDHYKEKTIKAKLKPPLKWAGGKRWLIKFIEPLWLESGKKRMVEPLCGGLAITLGLLPQQAFINDINVHLINFYRWLKKGLLIEMEMINKKDFYYSCRERFNDLIARDKTDSLEAASLFYYLNRTGYNGLCRFNRKGFFNVPYGSYDRINYRRDFLEFRNIFRNWDLSVVDFEKLEFGADDFIYADPPYDVEFTSYTAGGFSWSDQQRFAHWLSRQQGPVVASNQATERVIELYSCLGFEFIFLDGPRMISCDGNRLAAREILAFKGLQF